MNVVEPTIEFCDYRGLRKIELIGKVCTKQEDSIKSDSAETFCRNRLIDGHTAIFEHEYVYFNVVSIPNRIVREFVKLSPYIRWSYLGNYIGFSYRVFLDIMSNSRKMKAIYNDIYHPSEVNDLFYNMLLLSKEFSHLLFDDKDITAKLEYGIDASLRIASDAEILANAPEIYNVTYKITTDRGITHEAVRHREMSFMQESTRWCNYAKGRFGYKYGKNISVIEPPFKNEDSLEKFYDVVAGNEAIYQELTNDGEPAQLARSVLPTATKSDIYVSGTLDMWIGEHLETVYPKLTIVENKGFLPLRNHKAAHPQMIEIAKMIAEDIAVRFPNETGRIINYFE